MNPPKTLKVLWLASWYPSRVLPQSAGFVRRQAEATAAQLVSVCVIHATEDATVSDYEITTAEQHNLLEINVYYPKSRVKFLKIIRLCRALLRGWQRARRDFGQPDLVHLHVLYPSGILGLWLHFRYGLPFVVTEHRGGYIHATGSYRGGFMKAFTWFTVRRAAAVLALSNYFAAAMQGHGLRNRRYRIVPNVVDVERFFIKKMGKEDTLEATLRATTTFHFVHVSMMDDRIKNITGILRATAQLVERRSDFHLEIIGDGYDRDKILTVAAALELEKMVSFRGVLPHFEVSERMSAADAFILFSNIEALPCVILEAMSCGLPTIATETGGMSEWITPQTGVLLDIGDEEGLAEAMNFLIENRDQFDPSVIRQKIVQQCSVHAVGQAIAKVYAEVLTPQ